MIAMGEMLDTREAIAQQVRSIEADATAPAPIAAITLPRTSTAVGEDSRAAFPSNTRTLVNSVSAGAGAAVAAGAWPSAGAAMPSSAAITAAASCTVFIQPVPSNIPGLPVCAAIVFNPGRFRA